LPVRGLELKDEEQSEHYPQWGGDQDKLEGALARSREKRAQSSFRWDFKRGNISDRWSGKFRKGRLLGAQGDNLSG